MVIITILEPCSTRCEPALFVWTPVLEEYCVPDAPVVTVLDVWV